MNQPVMFPYQPGPFDPKISVAFVIAMIPTAEWVKANAEGIAAGRARPNPEECQLAIVAGTAVEFPTSLALPDGRPTQAIVPVEPLVILDYKATLAQARKMTGRPSEG